MRTGYAWQGSTGSTRDTAHGGGYLHRWPRQRRSTNKETQLFEFDARNIPFEDEFDVLGAFDVLEHVDRDEEVLAGMHRSLREGGGTPLAVPQHPWLWSASDDYAEHKRRYTRAELTSKVARAGFTVRRVTSFITLLLPLMVASRVAERLSRRSYDPDREFQAARRLDRALERVCDAERRLIMRGIDLPAGGSLTIGRQPSMSRLTADSLHIPFNLPYTTGRELSAIADAIARGHISADGDYSRECRFACRSARDLAGAGRALVHGGARAERAAARVGPGDEVIMPSYTFVTTATAFALRGATPVFVDIRPDTYEHRRVARRGRDHRPHAGDRRGPLRRGGVRDARRCRRSPKRTRSRSSRTPPKESAPATRASRWERSGRWRDQLPRDQERHLRQRGSAVGDDDATRAGGGAPRQGDQPQQLHPRGGRPVHLDRPRILIRDQRPRGRLPAPPAPGERMITASEGGCGTPTTRRSPGPRRKAS